jgi:hypothetical protein
VWDKSHKKWTRDELVEWWAWQVYVAFVTYGDDAYENSRERICAEARATCWFGELMEPYTLEDGRRLVAPSPRASAVLNRLGRGGGYWVWKPLVIREALSKLREEEVLLYCDAGCSLRQPLEPFWRRRMAAMGAPPRKCFDCHQLSGDYFHNGRWCRADAAHHVLQGDAKAVGEFFNTRQHESGRLLMVDGGHFCAAPLSARSP